MKIITKLQFALKNYDMKLFKLFVPNDLSYFYVNNENGTI